MRRTNKEITIPTSFSCCINRKSFKRLPSEETAVASAFGPTSNAAKIASPSISSPVQVFEVGPTINNS